MTSSSPNVSTTPSVAPDVSAKAQSRWTVIGTILAAIGLMFTGAGFTITAYQNYQLYNQKPLVWVNQSSFERQYGNGSGFFCTYAFAAILWTINLDARSIGISANVTIHNSGTLVGGPRNYTFVTPSDGYFPVFPFQTQHWQVWGYTYNGSDYPPGPARNCPATLGEPGFELYPSLNSWTSQ